MRLRDVEVGDVDAYVRMRCDPLMTAELGGPRLAADMPDKVARDVAQVAADRAWISMIVVGHPPDETVAGTVTLYRRGDGLAEIGWMVLPEHQRRGLAAAAVRIVLDRAAADGRWGIVHAFPAQANAASNGVCRATGFEFVAGQEVEYAGRTLRVNHWRA